MKWVGQNIYDQISKFRNTVDFSKNVTFYQPVNNADPQISIGASDDERLKIQIAYQGTTTQTAQIVNFSTFTESTTANDGRYHFSVDGTRILKIQDDGISLDTNMGLAINDVDIITDSSGTATLSNIDALDATTISTLNAALTAGDITGVEAGTGLSGGGTAGAVTLNVSGLTVSEIAAGSILVAGETFADNDTSLMSAAAINDRIESFGYTTNTGDITSVVAGTGLNGGGTSGDVTLNVDVASAADKGIVELATTAETTTGTDANRAVTPDGLKDGYQGSTNVTTLGTIGTGTWQGTVINKTYIDPDQRNITGVGTIGTGTWNGDAIAHAYIAADAIGTDNIADAQVTVAKLHADAIQTSGESFADNDTSLMTSAAIDDKINTKYSTSYITFSVKTSSTHGTNYILLHGSGISGGLVSIDSGTDSATDFGTRDAEDAGSSTETCDVATTNLEQQIPIPETCKLMGFYATTTTTTNTGAAYDTGVAIWHIPEANVNWGSSTAGTATLIHKSDSSMHAENTAHGGANRKKVQKVERMGGTAKTLAAGDIIVPSVFGETAGQQITATITLVIATPIKTI